MQSYTDCSVIRYKRRFIRNVAVLGEVVGVHIDQKMIRGGIYDTVSSEVIMR
jgi:hypothetical protein